MVNLLPTQEDELAKSIHVKGLSTKEQQKKLVDEMVADTAVFDAIDISHDNVATAERALQGLYQRVSWNPFTRRKDQEHNRLLDDVLSRDELRADLTRVTQEIERASRLKNAIDARVARIEERLQNSPRVFGAWHSFWLRRAEKDLAKNEQQLITLEEQAGTARDGLSTADRSSSKIKQNFITAQRDMELAWEELEPYLNTAGFSPAHLAAATNGDLRGVLFAMGLLQPTGEGSVFAYGLGRLPGLIARNLPAWLNPALVRRWEERRAVAETLRRLQTAFFDMERYREGATALEVIDVTRAQAKQKIDAILALTPENKSATMDRIATMRQQEEFLDRTGTSMWEIEQLRVSPEREEVILPHRIHPNCFVRFGYEVSEQGFSYVLPGGGRTSSLAEAAHAQLGVERQEFLQDLFFNTPFAVPVPGVLAPLGVTLATATTATAMADVTHLEIACTYPRGQSGQVRIPLADIPLSSGVTGARPNGQPTFTVDITALTNLVRERMYTEQREALRTAALLGTGVGGAPIPLETSIQAIPALAPFAGTVTSTAQINPGPPETLTGVEFLYTHPDTLVTHKITVTDPARFPVDFTPAGVAINGGGLATALLPTLDALNARKTELDYLNTQGTALAGTLASTFDQFPEFKNGTATVSYVPAVAVAPAAAHFSWECTKLGGIAVASGTLQLSAEDLTFVRTGGAVTGIDAPATHRVMRIQLEAFFQKHKEVAKAVRAALAPAKEALIQTLSIPKFNKTTSEWEMEIRKRDGNKVTVKEADLAGGITATFTPAPAPGNWTLAVDPALVATIEAML